MAIIENYLCGSNGKPTLPLLFGDILLDGNLCDTPADIIQHLNAFFSSSCADGSASEHGKIPQFCRYIINISTYRRIDRTTIRHRNSVTNVCYRLVVFSTNSDFVFNGISSVLDAALLQMDYGR